MPNSIWSARGVRQRLIGHLRSLMWLGAVVLLNHVRDNQPAYAQPATPAPKSDQPTDSTRAGGSISIEELARRMQALERQNTELADRNRLLTHQLDTVTRRCDELNSRLEQIEPGGKLPTPPLPAATPSIPALPPDAIAPPRPETDSWPSADLAAVLEQDEMGTPGLPPGNSRWWTAGDSSWPRRFIVGDYDDDLGAFVLVRPRDANRVPFELTFDVVTQARFTNFARSTDTWVDSTGARRPVQNYDSVEVTRNFLVFSGYALDPRLQYTAIIFSSTAINDTVYLGWMNYHLNDALDLRVGNWLVPGTREWYTSFRNTLGADRLMATTFFRPNISPGVWLQGEPIQGLHYVAMLANSLNRFTQGVQRVGSSSAFGGTVWWEPLGAFGPGPSDVENHQNLSTRLGTSVAISREANQALSGQTELANPEDTILRLSDGTPLFRPGALGPGVELAATNVRLWAIDAAFKYRGLSLSGEYFFRWLDGFKTYGQRPPFSYLFDTGGLLQASYFIVPTKFEAFARTSFVTGHFGGGHEVGGGVNWYPQGKNTWRFTFEVLSIDHSPAENLLTGYRAGESGMLYQLQWLTDF
jgi:hypothetical protein